MIQLGGITWLRRISLGKCSPPAEVIEGPQGPSSFPRLRVIKGHLAETLLCSGRLLELFNERCLFRCLVRIHAHYREVAHLAPHALKLGLQISQCWSDRLKPATLDPSWHAFFPKDLSRFPGH